MVNIKRISQATVVILGPLFLCACFGLTIVEDVRNPSRYFDKAYREIEKINRQDPSREGRVENLHILIYDGSDRQIVELTVPLWLANNYLELGEEIDDIERDLDFEKHYEFDWDCFDNLGDLGPGLLIEIDDNNSKILLWLE